MLETIIAEIVLKFGISFVLREINKVLNGMEGSKPKALANEIEKALVKYEKNQQATLVEEDINQLKYFPMNNAVIEIIKKWGIVKVLRAIIDLLNKAYDENLQRLGSEIDEALNKYEK